MLKVVIEKMLLEDNYMLSVLENPKESTTSFSLTHGQSEKLNDTINTVLNFFKIDDKIQQQQFFTEIKNNPKMRDHLIEYSQYKFTYVLASERSNMPVTVAAVWCS